MRSPGYSLIWWVEPGDIVFHYDRNQQAIVAWSRAVGRVEEAPVVWLAHRAATRRRIGTPTPQPGWWLDLDGPYPLPQPVTLAELRARGDLIRTALEEQRSRFEGSLYFPFFFYGGEELRPMQPYLNKLPAAIVRMFPALADSSFDEMSSIAALSTTATALGTKYRTASVSPIASGRDPFSVDPAAVERGLKGHADTQNTLAVALEAAGSEPRSPQPGDPNFDIAWERGGMVYVAEVKSVTSLNEERQLRLGLGQVLRYRDLLRAAGRTDVQAVLVTEREPRDASWKRLCSELGVALTHPPDFASLEL
jgi:hypothetical protein